VTKGSVADPGRGCVEALAAKYASDWPAWEHRRIAAMMRADGHDVSTSTVERTLRRRGLLLPRGFRADRKSWAALCRKVFHDPPAERNRVWQTDFSEFETPSGGIWRICAVIDYATRYCLAAKVTPTGRGSDALACLDAAVAEAERVLGLDDLREDRGELELVNETGEVRDVVSARSPSSRTTAPVFAARPIRLRSAATTRCCATSAPASDHR
jgi:putative transposase